MRPAAYSWYIGADITTTATITGITTTGVTTTTGTTTTIIAITVTGNPGAFGRTRFSRDGGCGLCVSAHRLLHRSSRQAHVHFGVCLPCAPEYRLLDCAQAASVA